MHTSPSLKHRAHFPVSNRQGPQEPSPKSFRPQLEARSNRKHSQSIQIQDTLKVEGHEERTSEQTLEFTSSTVYLNSVNSTPICLSLISEIGVTYIHHPLTLLPFRRCSEKSCPFYLMTLPPAPHHRRLLSPSGCTGPWLTSPRPCLFFSTVHPPKKNLSPSTLQLKNHTH